MENQLKINYSLTLQEHIESNNLYAINSNKFKSNLIFLVVFFWFILLSIWRITDHYFLIPTDYLKNLNSDKTTINYVQDIFWDLSIFIFFWCDTFPKFSPLNRWLISIGYHKNFVKQEPKQITISLDKITITSKNFRESREYQNLNKIIEGNKMFLLYYSRNSECIVIPKRIFNNETELNHFRNNLNSQVK